MRLVIPPSAVTENSIALLWERVEGAEIYLIHLNGKVYSCVRYTDVTLENLLAETEYRICVEAYRGGEILARSNEILTLTGKEPAAVNVLDFGADPRGKRSSTEALQRAIDRCPPGGRVCLPPGRYVSGALFLKSDMTLWVERGAVLKGSGRTEDFPVRKYRWEGRETDCYSSLLNAGIGGEGVRNLTVTGGGVIDANGVELFLREREENKGARGRALCLQDSRHIYIRDVTLRQSPAWCLHMIRCEDVSINGVSIETKYDEFGGRYPHIFNGDGIDCDSCRNIFIFNSRIASQDDCIAVKSGKDAEGRAAARPSENIWITRCRFESGFGVAIGSEMSGGVKNVQVRDCVFSNTFSIASVKTCRGRGGVMEDILFENVELRNADTEHADCKWFRGGIYVDCYYSNEEVSGEPREVSEETPLIRNVVFRNVLVDTCGGNAVYLSGLPERRCENITLENVCAVGKYGMKAYFIEGLHMKNVRVLAREGPDYVIEDCGKQ